MAQTRLWYPQTGTVTRFGFEDHYDKAMNDIKLRVDRVPMVNGQFFTEDDEKTNTYKMSTRGNEMALPIVTQDTSVRPFDQQPPGYSKTLTIVPYSMAVKITKEIVGMDLKGTIQHDMMSGLPTGLKRLLEYAMANVINTGAATAGADGSFIFGNDHYNEDASSGTWSNLETAVALSPSSVATMRRNMRKRKNARGHYMGIKMTKLMTGVDLMDEAWTIVNSKKTSNDSLNGESSIYKAFDLVVNDYMTDTNAFAGWGDLPESMWGFHAAFRDRPVVESLGYPSPEYPRIVKGFYSFVAFVVGASQAKNMHWNAGA
jgi:hypothetical protein